MPSLSEAHMLDTVELQQKEIHMSEEELEVLITLDDPGEDSLEEDTFDHSQAGNTIPRRTEVS